MARKRTILPTPCVICGQPSPGKSKYCLLPKTRGRSDPRKPPNRVCHHCGKHFRAPPSDPQRFCSYECHLARGGAYLVGAASRRARSKYGPKKDANHKEIVDALLKMGVAVEDMSDRGCGFPDLMVACGGKIHFLEIKNPKTYYGLKGLNRLQKIWESNWKGGPVHIIYTIDEAIEFVNKHGWQPGEKFTINSVESPEEALRAVGL